MVCSGSSDESQFRGRPNIVFAGASARRIGRHVLPERAALALMWPGLWQRCRYVPRTGRVAAAGGRVAVLGLAVPGLLGSVAHELLPPEVKLSGRYPTCRLWGRRRRHEHREQRRPG
eukprot:scaffold18687_cov118-Isochrysis_galbana.AAC.3